MAEGDFRDKVQMKRTEAQQKYYDSSDEAWDQIKDFFTDPVHWLVALIAVLLITAGVFTVKFVSAVRAPKLPPQSAGGAVTVGQEPAPVQIGDSSEVIDDSNAVEPMLSGARKEGFYTFLLFGEDKISKSTDTIMVVSYDVKNQKLNLMSIPRDTMVNVSWDIKKINSVYSVSGVKGLQKHIGKLIGFVPDYYVRIDLNAFIDVVNLLGGIEFDVPIPMHYHDPAQGLSIDLEPGLQTLNGEQAMGLVRFRKSDRSSSGRVTGYDDTGRVKTQQEFLKVMFKKCLELKNWSKITGYVEIFEKNVESDLTLGNMLWFARQAMDLNEDGFTTCTIPCNPYASAWSRSTNSMQSYVTLYGKQVVELVNESFNPYLSRVTLSNLDIMTIKSDGSVASSTGYVADSRAAQPVVHETAEEANSETDSEEPAGEEGTENHTSEGAGSNREAEHTSGNTEGASGTSDGSGTDIHPAMTDTHESGTSEDNSSGAQAAEENSSEASENRTTEQNTTEIETPESQSPDTTEQPNAAPDAAAQEEETPGSLPYTSVQNSDSQADNESAAVQPTEEPAQESQIIDTTPSESGE